MHAVGEESSFSAEKCRAYNFYYYGFLGIYNILLRLFDAYFSVHLGLYTERGVDWKEILWCRYS